MKLLKLEINNLASLRGNFTINFEQGPLSSCRIFSIVGKMGSGKSTILDAICLALYGVAPRYLKKVGDKQKNAEKAEDTNAIYSNDPRNILSRGEKNGSATLYFEMDHKLYQAEWKVKFNLKKYDTATLTLKNASRDAEGNFVVTDANIGTAEALIGLNFDQFMRTIVLAQGAFDKFLKANVEEKTALMESIIGDELFAKIAEIIAQKLSDANKDVEKKQKDFDANHQLILDPEVYNSLVADIKKIEQEHDDNTEKNTQLTTAINWYSDEAGLQGKKGQADNDLTTAKNNYNARSADQKLLNLHDATTAAVQQLRDVNNLTTEAANFEKLAKQAITDKAKYESQKQTKEEELGQLNTSLTKAQEVKGATMPLVNQARGLEGEVRQLKEDIGNIDVKSAQDKVVNIKKAIAQNDTDTVTAQNKIGALASQKTNTTQSFDEKKEAHNKLVEEAKTNSATLTKKWEGVSEAELQSKRDLAFAVCGISTKLQNIRLNLKQGDVCPVCGSTEHKSDFHSELETVGDEEAAAKNDFKEKDTKLQAYKADKSLLEGYQTTINNANQTLLDLEKEKNDAIAAIDIQINKEKAKISGFVSQLESLLQQKREAEDSLKTLTADKAAKEGQLKKLTDQINAWLNGKTADGLEKELTEAVDNISTAIDIKKGEIGELVTQIGNEDTKFSQNDGLAKDKTKEKDQKEEALAAWLTTYNQQHAEAPISKETLAQFLNNTTNWEALRTELNELENAVVNADAKVESAKKAVEEHLQSKPEKDKAALEAEKAKLQESFNAFKEVLPNMQNQKIAHDKAVTEEPRLQADLKAATKLKNNWELLSKAVGSSKGEVLRSAAQSITLQFLVSRANKQLKLFNPRYSLKQLEGTMVIKIIDHEMADECRYLDTLSGGETFTASLALALALSDLSSNKMSFENLFIDEGFGSLDQETRQNVINILANLQESQGKTIGIISHTDDCHDLISTQIQVVKNGNGESRINIR